MKISSISLFTAVLIAGMGTWAATGIPVEISSVEMLQMIGQDPSLPLSGHYVLTQDIEASQTKDWNDGAGFLPIGPRIEENSTAGFSGYFDGRGFVIRGLVIYRPEGQGVGLFGSVASSGVVANVGLEGGSITGGHYVGGIVGENWSESLAGCYSTAAIPGVSRVGGIAGINRGFIDASYAIGPVTGDFYVGGLVGRNYKGTVQECYAAGRVSGYTWTGGLIGETSESETIASFWDTTASAIGVSGGGTGKPTEELMLQETFAAAGWDFEAVWQIVQGKGYPSLKSAW